MNSIAFMLLIILCAIVKVVAMGIEEQFMSRLVNSENNAFIEIMIKSTDAVNDGRTGFDLSAGLVTPGLKIFSDCGAVLNVYDIRLLRSFFAYTISEEFLSENGTRRIADSNALFEMAVTGSHEDDMYSVEFWINTATASSGKRYGYDHGIRFAAVVGNYVVFAQSVLDELNEMVSGT